MKRTLIRLSALVLCTLFVHGTSRMSPEYFLFGGADPDRPTETFVFDRELHQVGAIPLDLVVPARHSGDRLRFRAIPGGGLRFADESRRAPCDAQWKYAFTPSGSRYACIAGYGADAVLHVYRTKDRHVLATIHLPTAVPFDVHPIAFADEDRLLFQSSVRRCPDEDYSISVMSIGGRFKPKEQVPCAKGVIVGDQQIVYLRGSKGNHQYSLDGRTWMPGDVYGIDANDRPITADSPLIRRFHDLYPRGVVAWVSVGSIQPGSR